MRYFKLIKENNMTVIIVLVLAAFVTLFVRSRFLSDVGFDEGLFIWYGSLINKGLVPYKDFFEPKPPVIFFANALGLKIFGTKHFLFRLFPSLIAVFSIFLLFPTLRVRKISIFLTALLTLQYAYWLLGPQFHDSGLNDSETYGLAFTIIGFSLVSISSVKEKKSKIGTALALVGGVAFGLATLSKELFLFSVIPAGVIACFHPRQKTTIDYFDLKALRLLIVGGLSVGLTFVAYLLVTESFKPYVDLLSFYRSLAANFCIDIGRFPSVSGFGVFQVSWQFLHSQLFNLRQLAFVLPMSACALFFLKRTWIIVTLFFGSALGVLAISIGHCFWIHYYLLGLTGLILPAVIGATLMTDRMSHMRPLPFIAIYGALTLALSASVLPTTLKTASEKKQFPSFSVDATFAKTVEEYTQAGDYVLTTGGPIAYIALDRLNPLPYLAVFAQEVIPYFPGSTDREKFVDLSLAIEKHLPKVMYFPLTQRRRQTAYFLFLFEPILKKYNYIKLSDEIWYLPANKNTS
jgi:hypothetical protein